MGAELNADGRLEVFARGSDNRLWHNSQSDPGEGPWVGWSSLGGPVGSGPAVVRRQDQLHIFASGPEGDLRHIFQKERNGSWSEWESAAWFPPGSGSSPPRIVGAPAAAVLDSGLIVVCFNTDDNYLLACLLDMSSGSPNWNTWDRLDGQNGWPGSNLPAICQDVDGNLKLFAVDPNAQIVSVETHVYGGSQLHYFGNPIGMGTSVVGRPAAVPNQDGRIEVVFTSTGGDLHTMWQATPGSPDWGGPVSLGGTMNSSPVMSRNADGRLEVFHIGTNGWLHNNWQTAPNNGWFGWQRRELNDIHGELCVARNPDLRLEIFALDTVGNMWHTWQTAPSKGPWSTESLGGSSLDGGSVHLIELGSRGGWLLSEA